MSENCAKINESVLNCAKINSQPCNTDLGCERNKKEKDDRFRNWVFTFNNYTQKDIEITLIVLNEKYSECSYVFQEEIGEQGTPHLQGLVCFKNATTLNALKKKLDPKIHWEVCRSVSKSIGYCTKRETRSGKIYSKGFDINDDVEIKTENWYPWKIKMLDIIKNEIEIRNERAIHVVYDPIGDCGKSKFVKELFLSKQFRIFFCTGGKSSDLTNSIIELPYCPELCLLDFPRCTGDYVCWNAVEQIKNGMVYCGKYKGGMKIFDSPVIVIFTNQLPDFEKMSLDRWRIWKIDENKELLKFDEWMVLYDQNRV